MFTRPRFLLAALLALTLLPGPSLAQTPGRVDALSSQILAWFDSLGMPNVSGKPFVRVETGRWIEPADGRRRYQSVVGFLLDEDKDSFTVYISGVLEFRPPNDSTSVPALGESDIRFAPMRTVRFERNFDLGEESAHASYTALGLGLYATELAERVRKQTLVNGYSNDLFCSLCYLAPGVQVVAFAHALRQSGRERQGDELLRLFVRAALTEPTEAWQNPLVRLQDTLGRTYVEWAETDMADGIVPRAKLIDVYADFGSLFPPGDERTNRLRDYMRDSAVILRRMAAEEAAHVDRPLASLPPAAQAADPRHSGTCLPGLCAA